MAVLLGFFLIQVIVQSPQQETSWIPPSKCRDTYIQGKRWEHQQELGLNGCCHAFWSLQSMERRIFQTVLQKCDFSAKQTVNEQNLESPLAGFGEYTSCLERVSKNCGFLPCISDADSFVGLRGVHPCLHRSVCVCLCSVPNISIYIYMTKLNTDLSSLVTLS